MREMIVCQRKEIERAIIGMGEYRVSDRFRDLSVDSRKFFLMTEKHREKILNHFFAAELTSNEGSNEGSSAQLDA